MKKFYTFDRAGTLRPGDELNLYESRVDNEPFKSFIDSLFPQGISQHGRQYLENHRCLFDSKDGSLELYFEEVRKAHFPCVPSRFESIFCCETVEDATDMSMQFKSEDAPVYEILVMGGYHRANMGLLNNMGSILAVSQRAHDYWRGGEGCTGSQPIWEILAKLPVRVGNRVK